MSRLRQLKRDAALCDQNWGSFHSLFAVATNWESTLQSFPSIETAGNGQVVQALASQTA